MAQSISDMTSVRQTSPGVYESLQNAEHMGNTANIAYGGCTIGVAVSTAYEGVPGGYFLYSIMGDYLGPALTDRNYVCRTEIVRRTRAFITKCVHVKQRQDDGRERSCMIALADFHLREPKSLLEYSAPPSMLYAGPEAQDDLSVTRQKLLEDGKISSQLAEMHAKTFGLMQRFIETRPCREGIGAQTLMGAAKHLPTGQEHLPLHARTSADWFRSRHSLDTPAEAASALAFVLDGAISFIPLTHSSMFLDDAGACSSLDFAFRLFTNDLKLEDWHLREIKTSAAGAGRTYGEACVWDSVGNMVASMTQTSIMRPKPETKPKM